MPVYRRAMVARRRFLVAMAAGGLGALAGTARAARYPSGPVRLVIGVAAGIQDMVARVMTDWLSRRLGQPFIVDTRSGAGGSIAAEAVVRATPDGRTLLLAGAPNAIGATLYPDLGFVFLRDIAPVGSIMRTPEILVAHPSVPVRGASALIEYARRHPGTLNIASPGQGTGPHMSAELLKMMAGVDITHVPYRGGGPAMAGLLAGQVQLLFIAPAVALPHVNAGKLRVLAITSPGRCPMLPDVQPLAEILPGYESGGFFGIGAPRATPADIVGHLNREVNAGLDDRDVHARLSEMGGTVLGGSPDAFMQLLRAETEKWARVIRFAGIKAA